MAIGVMFLAVAFMFIMISIDAYRKAQKTARDTETSIKKFKPLKATAISFLFTGITFGVLSIVWF